MYKEGSGNFPWESYSLDCYNPENSSDDSDEKFAKIHIRERSNNMLATLPTSQKRGRNRTLKKSKESDGKEYRDTEQEHEIHIWTERERRKKMRDMFSSLHAMLPQLPAKADKSTIVDEAVNYIEVLQLTLQKLQKQKLEIMQGSAIINCDASKVVAPAALMSDSREAYLADQGSAMNSNQGYLVPCLPVCLQTWSSPNVVLSVNEDDAQICICTRKKPGLLPMLFCILEKNNIDVVTAQISFDHFRCMLMIHAHANGLSNEQPEMALAVEQRYKLVAGEMAMWLSG